MRQINYFLFAMIVTSAALFGSDETDSRTEINKVTAIAYRFLKAEKIKDTTITYARKFYPYTTPDQISEIERDFNSEIRRSLGTTFWVVYCRPIKTKPGGDAFLLIDPIKGQVYAKSYGK